MDKKIFDHCKKVFYFIIYTQTLSKIRCIPSFANFLKITGKGTTKYIYTFLPFRRKDNFQSSPYLEKRTPGT